MDRFTERCQSSWFGAVHLAEIVKSEIPDSAFRQIAHETQEIEEGNKTKGY